MSEWLFKEDNYVPIKDNDAFIDKSILSFLQVLSQIKRGNVKSYKGLYEVKAVPKLFFTLILLILVSLSRSYLFLFTGVIYILFCMAFIEVEDIKKAFILGIVISLFTIVILIPSIISGNYNNSIMLVSKVFIAVVIVNTLSLTTKWYHVTKALKMFFIPDIFILVMEITLRYIYLLGEFSLNMLYALKLRSVGKNDNKYSSMTQMMGTLFLKSKEMGDEMYSAMECRGFTGEYASFRNIKLSLKDVLYISVNLLIVLMFILLP